MSINWIFSVVSRCCCSSCGRSFHPGRCQSGRLTAVLHVTLSARAFALVQASTTGAACIRVAHTICNKLKLISGPLTQFLFTFITVFARHFDHLKLNSFEVSLNEQQRNSFEMIINLFLVYIVALIKCSFVGAEWNECFFLPHTELMTFSAVISCTSCYCCNFDCFKLS